MSERSSKLLLISLCICCAVFFSSSTAAAQDDSSPKYDIFLGYQWVHPGITVAAPNYTTTNPLTLKLPDMPKGGGEASPTISRGIWDWKATWASMPVRAID